MGSKTYISKTLLLYTVDKLNKKEGGVTVDKIKKRLTDVIDKTFNIKKGFWFDLGNNGVSAESGSLISKTVTGVLNEYVSGGRLVRHGDGDELYSITDFGKTHLNLCRKDVEKYFGKKIEELI